MRRRIRGRRSWGRSPPRQPAAQSVTVPAFYRDWHYFAVPDDIKAVRVGIWYRNAIDEHLVFIGVSRPLRRYARRRHGRNKRR